MNVGKINFKKALLDEVSNFIGNYGFDKKQHAQSFFRPTDSGRGIFHLAFIPHKNIDCDVTADVAIRVDAIEELVNFKHGKTPPGEGFATSTLGCELGNLESGRQKRWTLTSLDDISLVGVAIEKDIRSLVLPFFERFSDLESIYKALSSLDPKDWLLAPLYAARCERVIASAFILGKFQELERAVQDYKESLRVRNDYALDRFTELSTFLLSKIPHTD